jgi:hypothetical protein
MPAQSQESKRAGMEEFLDIYQEFESAMICREGYFDNLSTMEVIALFAAYISRME